MFGVAIVILGLFPSTASAELRWRVREYDSIDEPHCDPDLAPCLGWDIRTVTVKIRDADNGRAYLVITLRSYTAQGGFASGVALDTKGSPRPTIAPTSIRRDWPSRRAAAPAALVAGFG
jgi:hypothetical protein